MLHTAQAGHKPEAYLEAALQGELTQLATSANGSRNDALNKAAFALGQLIPLGLAESSVRSRLEAVALAIGLSSEEIRLTIDSGLAAGMASPRTDKTDTTSVSSVMSGEDWPKPQPVKQLLQQMICNAFVLTVVLVSLFARWWEWNVTLQSVRLLGLCLIGSSTLTK